MDQSDRDPCMTYPCMIATRVPCMRTRNLYVIHTLLVTEFYSSLVDKKQTFLKVSIHSNFLSFDWIQSPLEASPSSC